MKTLVISIAILSTGVMAGIFFIWTNAVKPGIGKLDDYIYLSSFQSMNRAILNPAFYLVFLLPVFSLPASTALHFGSKAPFDFRLLLAATIIYLIGAFLMTVFGNIPLNELLDQSDLERMDAKKLDMLREKIEHKWNRFNLIRTLSSVISFVFLVMCVVVRK